MNRAQAWDVETRNYRPGNGEWVEPPFIPQADDYALTVRTHEATPIVQRQNVISTINSMRGGKTASRAQVYRLVLKSLAEIGEPVSANALMVPTGKSSTLLRTVLLEMTEAGMVTRTGPLKHYLYSVPVTQEAQK